MTPAEAVELARADLAIMGNGEHATLDGRDAVKICEALIALAEENAKLKSAVSVTDDEREALESACRYLKEEVYGKQATIAALTIARLLALTPSATASKGAE